MLAPANAFEDVGELLPQQDKIVHGVLFLTLGVLARWSRSAGARVRRPSGGLAWSLLYAVTIEALQPLVGGAGRVFDWLDLACNVVGVGSGWLLCGVAAGYHGRREAR